MIMKNSTFFTNKYFFIVATAVICGTATIEVAAIRVEQTQKATKSVFFNFEIMNKSAVPIWVELSTSGNMLLDATGVAPMFNKKERGYLRSGDIDTMRHLNVTIYRNNKQPEEHHIYADGKTIFLTWDGKDLRPQTGTFLGLSKTTDSGLSLKNNVTIDDIDPIWEK
jgi:hypothetical protein